LFIIRKISPADNAPLEHYIRDIVLNEFKGDPQTTIAGDPVLKTMYENYQVQGAVYFVAELDGRLAGGCGIHGLDGSGNDTCELQRMFLVKEARGLGIGKRLLEMCLEEARNAGYKAVYLETLSVMEFAIAFYKRAGFEIINGRLGSTGHTACEVCMLKKI